VVECTGFENQQGRKLLVSSNLTLSAMDTETKERNIHALFRLSLVAKGAFALLEIIGGILAYFISQEFVQNLAATVTENELAGDPNDLIANLLLSAAHSYSVGSQYFVAFYLLSHGVIKLILIIGLWRGKLWYYPASLVVFTLFIAYQLFRYTHTHSFWLLVITVLDVLVIWLVWHEYRFLQKMKDAPASP
jgi:uncharacterized membrane protein